VRARARAAVDPVWKHPRTGAQLFVGNQDAAKHAVARHGIRSVVNCTDSLPEYTQDTLRFHVSGWALAIRNRPVRAEQLIAFFAPVWQFIDERLERGESGACFRRATDWRLVCARVVRALDRDTRH
jgi:hypothetical protein